MNTPYEYLDRCPRCNQTLNHPLTTTWQDGGIRTTYRCRCGKTWFTGWDPQNGESEATFKEAC